MLGCEKQFLFLQKTEGEKKEKKSHYILLQKIFTSKKYLIVDRVFVFVTKSFYFRKIIKQIYVTLNIEKNIQQIKLKQLRNG